MEENKEQTPKYRGTLQALDNLSLGLSMVAAVAIGFGIGYGLKKLTGIDWLLWLGIFWGLAAAGLNIYKAYKRGQKEFEELANDPRYTHRAKYGDNIEDDRDN